MSKEAILVTGAAGFIGMHVTRRLLERGEHVIGIDNLNDYYDVSLKEARLAELSRTQNGRFEMLRLDFADNAALDEALATKRFDRIVHLGAQAGVRYSLENPRAYIRSNIDGHLNMLEIARERDLRHCVYASSSSVYGSGAKLPFRVEDRVDHPLSLYAATKRADELMSDTYAHLYRIPLTGLRFFTVYGPWGRPDMAMWLFTSAILEGRPINVYNAGDMRRDFTFIDDIVAGVIACLDLPPSDEGPAPPHRLYNIGNSKSEPLERLIALIETACGREAVRHEMPMQPGDMKDTFADISAIERDLNFRPSTTLELGVPRFVDWYRGYAGI
ncbi:NAD-dependent epimerase [Sphingomonas oligophenolica]|uniref:SDR family NAD(P)-dependent oxidoreductase n=1 Tax=Sphingomonas oligophenolica TaxID=301154 RepID=A0ABU9YC07_9SPHN